MGPLPHTETDISDVTPHPTYLLTIIDICTRFVEIIQLSTMDASTVSQAYHNQWLYRYPRPSRLLSDNGPQFISHEFNRFLDSFLIKQQLVNKHFLQLVMADDIF
jgi:transposase InsO family protein